MPTTQPRHAQPVAVLIRFALSPFHEYFDRLADVQAVLDSLPPPRRHAFDVFCLGAATRALRELAAAGNVREARKLIEGLGSLRYPNTHRQADDVKRARTTLEALRAVLRTYSKAIQ